MRPIAKSTNLIRRVWIMVKLDIVEYVLFPFSRENIILHIVNIIQFCDTKYFRDNFEILGIFLISL